MSALRVKRLQKELKGLQRQSAHHSFRLLPLPANDALDVLHMEMTVPDHPLYKGQVFLLRFKFPGDYPISSPECVFLPGKRQPTPIQQGPAVKGSSRDAPISLDDDDDVDIQATERGPDNYSIPLHPHIYSNGHICLDLLYAPAWSPVQNVESVTLSVLSMLAGNTTAERPPDDAAYSSRTPAGSNPKRTNWVFVSSNTRA